MFLNYYMGHDTLHIYGVILKEMNHTKSEKLPEEKCLILVILIIL